MAGNRKVTKAVCGAFLAGKSLTMGNSHTDGKALYLFGNKIAEWQDGTVWITDAGWNTVTTRERLNGLGCQVHTQKGQLYLNGEKWDGKWIDLPSS